MFGVLRCMIDIETCVYLIAFRYKGLAPFSNFDIGKGKCMKNPDFYVLLLSDYSID